MVFQRPNPFPTMNIFDNVVSGLRFAGIRKRSFLREAAEVALHQAALWDLVKDRLDASALSLSGGQQQRLCIARALAVRPEVLLMDEPCSALDPIATAKVEHLITGLAGQVTVVLVTHNMFQAARVSDKRSGCSSWGRTASGSWWRPARRTRSCIPRATPVPSSTSRAESAKSVSRVLATSTLRLCRSPRKLTTGYVRSSFWRPLQSR